MGDRLAKLVGNRLALLLACSGLPAQHLEHGVDAARTIHEAYAVLWHAFVFAQTAPPDIRSRVQIDGPDADPPPVAFAASLNQRESWRGTITAPSAG